MPVFRHTQFKPGISLIPSISSLGWSEGSFYFVTFAILAIFATHAL